MPILTLPIRPHANQQRIIDCKSRFTVTAAGRRFGKTEAYKLRAIYKVMEGKVAWWVNPTFDNGTDAWLDFLNFFDQFVPRDQINKSSRRIFAPTGGQLRMIGANNFKRGSGVDEVFVDEAAFCDLKELWDYQLRPMLLETKGGAHFFSSTNGRNGFWDLYRLACDPQEAEWQAFHFTSYDNPLIDPVEIEAIRRNTPERVFRQEYMAEFLEDGGAVFRNIRACIRPPQAGVVGDVVFGVDLGRHNDYTVIFVMDAKTHQMLAMDRFTEIGWQIQLTRLQALANTWKPSAIWMEENFNDSFVEQAHNSGLPVRAYRTTAGNKQQLINSLALAFEQGDIGILDDPVLIGELQAYTMERLPSGLFRYSAPPGGHDDTVIAMALAWHGAAMPARVAFEIG